MKNKICCFSFKKSINIIITFCLIVFIFFVAMLIIYGRSLKTKNCTDAKLVPYKLSVKSEFETKNEKLQTIIPKPKSNILELKKQIVVTKNNLDELKTFEDITTYLYSVDETAFVRKEDLDIKKFINANLATNLKAKEPKVLIFHTHSQEDFIDSKKGVEDDTIVGIGSELANILSNEHGVFVLHDVGKYDVLDGKTNRDGSYERMESAVLNILKKYPTIEVLIDLHRDGVPENVHLVEKIDGKDTAKIMFFNGITCLNVSGKPHEMPNLQNEYLEDNLALSLQLQLNANEMYPNFARNIYIKAYRYSLNMAPKSMLVEVGANTNTVQEAKNAMKPLAKIIVTTLEAKK